MRLFLTQLRWEFRKLWARPRTYFGFAGALVWVVAVSILLRIPAARIKIQRDLWHMRMRFDEAFSGLTTAAHLMGEAITVVGALALALVAADLIAQEAHDGSLRLAFCRPVSRGRIFAIKLVVCFCYSALLVFFIAGVSLLAGLLFEGPGPLIFIALHESIAGGFDFATGLERYWSAAALLVPSAATGALIAFTASCFPLKPIVAVCTAVGIFFADNALHAAPMFEEARPYCLTTHLLMWRQVFNEDIPWGRLERFYTRLLILDGLLLATAWAAFRRRELKA